MKDEDSHALWGLAENRSLSLEQLWKVRDRLTELGDSVGVELAEWRIKELQKTQAPEDPEELFSEEGRKGQFLEDKIDLIGTRLLSLERRVTKHLKLMLIAVAIAGGVAFLMLVIR